MVDPVLSKLPSLHQQLACPGGNLLLSKPKIGMNDFSKDKKVRECFLIYSEGQKRMNLKILYHSVFFSPHIFL